jgi:hypothetical protein
VLRVDGKGQLESILELGEQAYDVAPGADHMLVASIAAVAPVNVAWCANGVAPCDRYALGETDAIGNVVAVGLQPTVAYVAGRMRFTPAGAHKPRTGSST